MLGKVQDRLEASTVNTLFPAYTGSALPLLVILSLQTEPLGTLVNREFLSTEIMRTLVGSIGIAAAVTKSLRKLNSPDDGQAVGHSHTHY